MILEGMELQGGRLGVLPRLGGQAVGMEQPRPVVAFRGERLEELAVGAPAACGWPEGKRVPGPTA